VGEKRRKGIIVEEGSVHLFFMPGEIMYADAELKTDYG